MGKVDFRDQNVQIAALVVFVSLAIAYVFFLTSLVPFGFRPRSESLATLETEYERISADLMKAKQTASRLPQVQAEFAQIQQRWEEAKVLLPTEKEMAELLTQVTIAGQRAGVEFLLFEPQTPSPKDIYVEHPVEVTVEGGYHDVGMFLSRLSNLPRIVNVNSIAMKNIVPDAKDPEAPEEVEAGMSISAYRLLTEEERARIQSQSAAPAAPAKGAAPAHAQAAGGASHGQ